MTNHKLDRRKKYTRMVLKDSLMALLKEKPIASITVKEICEIADINRSTFYSHYADLYDLLEQIEAQLIEDMKIYLGSYHYKQKDDALEITEKLIEYIATKQDECQTLLSENSHSSFEQKVKTVAHHFIMKNWLEIKEIDKDISQYVSAFIISGSIHVIKVWLQNGMDKSPKEMATIITNIVNHGIFGME